MSEIKLFIIENITVSVIIAAFMFIIAILTYRLNNRKSKFDSIDFESKKPNFSIYLENSYRFEYLENKEKFLMFNIRITNHSSSKNSLIPKLKIAYFIDHAIKSELFIEYDFDNFDNLRHNNLTKFSKEIRIEDREIKSGWTIFKYPKPLDGKRIDFYELFLEDGIGNKSSVICNLIKEIVYEN